MAEVTPLRPVNDGPDYFRTPKGEIKPIYYNVVRLLEYERDHWQLGFDTFAQRHTMRGRIMDDADLRAISDWVQRNGILASTGVIAEAAMAVADARPHHPVRDWLDGLTWDGVSRIDELLIDHAGVADTPLHRQQTAKFMIQAVARIYRPGCQADATLVLEGGQGAGKSTLLRELFGDDWFTDHLPDISTKDAMQQLAGVWCIEIAELATLGKSDAAKIKQFLTSRVDRYRPSYGRLVVDVPRQCVFAGTVNPGAGGYLKDETGGRRFWPVAVGADINTGAIRDNRDQYWAEAVTRYRDGETWHLANGDAAKAAQEAQADRFVYDPWQETIETFLRDRSETSVADVLIEALGLTEKGRWTQGDMNRVARCLTHIGWNRFRARRDGRLQWRYKREQGAVFPVSEPDLFPVVPTDPSLGGWSEGSSGNAV